MLSFVCLYLLHNNTFPIVSSHSWYNSQVRYYPARATGFIGVNRLSMSIGVEIDPEWSHGPRRLPRLDGVGGMRIAGISVNLAARTGSSCWRACCLGEGPRTRTAGCENVGRGTEGSVCLGTLHEIKLGKLLQRQRTECRTSVQGPAPAPDGGKSEASDAALLWHKYCLKNNNWQENGASL
jgi:hypothetical protein